MQYFVVPFAIQLLSTLSILISTCIFKPISICIASCWHLFVVPTSLVVLLLSVTTIYILIPSSSSNDTYPMHKHVHPHPQLGNAIHQSLPGHIHKPTMAVQTLNNHNQDRCRRQPIKLFRHPARESKDTWCLLYSSQAHLYYFYFRKCLDLSKPSEKFCELVDLVLGINWAVFSLHKCNGWWRLVNYK